MKLFPLAILALLALPAVAALPGLCGSDCRIDASSFPGYEPVVAVLASGSTVTWHSTDIGHITEEATIGFGPKCFIVPHPGSEDSPGVRFDIVGDFLVATMDTPEVCASAEGNAEAGFVLHYFCSIHPTMRGALVVTA